MTPEPVCRPLNNVLVASDLSHDGQLALLRALRLPCADGAKLRLLHVVNGDEELQLVGEKEAVLAHRLDEAALAYHLDEAYFHARAAADGTGGPSLDIISSTVRGKASAEILRAARQHKSQLIVLGRYGVSAMRCRLLGSTAKGVIRSAGTSVLVVSQPVFGPYRRPLVAVDLSVTSRLALDAALRVADRDMCSIDVVHAHGARDGELPLDFVWQDYEQEARSHLAQVTGSVANARIEWNTVIERGNPTDVILDAAAWRGSDLIVLGACGHSEIDRPLIGGIAEAVVLNSRCDVLVVRSAEDSSSADGVLSTLPRGFFERFGGERLRQWRRSWNPPAEATPKRGDPARIQDHPVR